MRVKKALVKSKNHMWVCWPECATLNNRMCLNELCNCWDPTTREMEKYAIDWFESTEVFSDLSPEAQQEAVQEMQAILDAVWDWVAPFYYAVQEWRTFAQYLDENNLEADESWPCDDTLYNNQWAFVLYVSTMWAIDCKYLAVAPTRWRSGWRLVNADLIADYLDKVTYSTVTYTFKDWDGTVLKVWTVEMWQTPTAPTDPTRPATAEYTYTFTGWSPTLWPTYEDITYTAQYEATLNTFTVVWKNYDWTVLETDTSVPYGETPTYNWATPTKASTAQYSYTFSWWNPSVEPATADAEYIAQFTEVLNTYTVVWKNYDWTVLETDAAVSYGDIPTYNWATPTKASTAQYTYTFNWWSPAVVAVTGNAEYTAQFTETVRGYTILWKNYDWTVLETDTNVSYWTTPTYNWATPTKPDSAQYSYEFDGWSPSVVAVTQDTEYTAHYLEHALVTYYRVRFTSSNSLRWSISPSYVDVAEGTKILVDNRYIHLDDETSWTYTDVLASWRNSYSFSWWSATWWIPDTVTWNITITANFATAIQSINTSEIPSPIELTPWDTFWPYSFAYSPTGGDINTLAILGLPDEHFGISSYNIEKVSNWNWQFYITTNNNWDGFEASIVVPFATQKSQSSWWWTLWNIYISKKMVYIDKNNSITDVTYGNLIQIYFHLQPHTQLEQRNLAYDEYFFLTNQIQYDSETWEWLIILDPQWTTDPHNPMLFEIYDDSRNLKDSVELVVERAEPSAWITNIMYAEDWMREPYLIFFKQTEQSQDYVEMLDWSLYFYWECDNYTVRAMFIDDGMEPCPHLDGYLLDAFYGAWNWNYIFSEKAWASIQSYLEWGSWISDLTYELNDLNSQGITIVEYVDPNPKIQFETYDNFKQFWHLVVYGDWYWNAQWKILLNLTWWVNPQEINAHPHEAIFNWCEYQNFNVAQPQPGDDPEYGYFMDCFIQDFPWPYCEYNIWDKIFEIPVKYFDYGVWDEVTIWKIIVYYWWDEWE